MSRIILALGLLAATAITAQCDDDLSVLPLDEAAQTRAAAKVSLSGRFSSPEEQCQSRSPGYYVKACLHDDPAKMCEDLKCSYGRGDIPHGEGTGRALDGTWCGDGMMCYQGSCVEDREPLNHPVKTYGSILCEYSAPDAEGDESAW